MSADTLAGLRLLAWLAVPLHFAIICFTAALLLVLAPVGAAALALLLARRHRRALAALALSTALYAPLHRRDAAPPIRPAHAQHRVIRPARPTGPRALAPIPFGAVLQPPRAGEPRCVAVPLRRRSRPWPQPPVSRRLSTAEVRWATESLLAEAIRACRDEVEFSR